MAWRAPASAAPADGSLPGIDRWQTPSSLDFAGHQAVINLAGEPIDRRWTEENKRLFHESRVGVTRRVVEAIRALPADARPKVLINGSAVGIYGDRGDEVFDRRLAPRATAIWRSFAANGRTPLWRLKHSACGWSACGPASSWAATVPHFRKLVRVFKSGLGGRLGLGPAMDAVDSPR